MYIRLRSNSPLLELCEVLPEKRDKNLNLEYLKHLHYVLELTKVGLYKELPYHNYYQGRNGTPWSSEDYNTAPDRCYFVTLALTGKQLKEWPEIKKILKDTGFKRLHKPERNFNMKDKQPIHAYGLPISRETGKAKNP